MNKCTEIEFHQQHQQLKENGQSGLSGPFIDSAPAGNIFRGPFREFVWVIGQEPMLKKTWTPETGWQFFRKDPDQHPGLS